MGAQATPPGGGAAARLVTDGVWPPSSLSAGVIEASAPLAGMLPLVSRHERGKPMHRRMVSTLWRRARLIVLVMALLSASLTLTFWNNCPSCRPSKAPSSLMGPPDLVHHPTHLVLVAGHAVLQLHEALRPPALRRDSAWVLEPYQEGMGVPSHFLEHLRLAVLETARHGSDAVLVLSGGQTRPTAPPASEALSYWLAADSHHWWGHEEVRGRTILEEYASDSFENLLFGIARFREATGGYPRRFSVVSYRFKERRFRDLHAKALRIPPKDFAFLSEAPTALRGFNLEGAMEGEQTNARIPFENDPYGCHSSILREKRKQRNPFSRRHAYVESAPELKALLEWCGPQFYSGELPWSSGSPR